LKKVVLYWSNICVLHKYEKEYLQKVRDVLFTEGIDLQIHFFGIGYPKRMSEEILASQNDLPDIIVSTDLEVFENKNIFSKYSLDLYEISDWIPTKKSPLYQKLYEDKRLLPFIAIPMMIYSSSISFKGLSNKDLLSHKLALGGINNSAAKTIFKYFWSEYGKEKAISLLNNSMVLDMPIQGMQAVKTKLADVAFLPSVYALRADMQNNFSFVPNDGCIVLPSFVAIRKSITEEIAQNILLKILTVDFCKYFVDNADLISLIEGTPDNRSIELQQAQLLYPSRDWLVDLSPEEFYDIYCKLIPKATDYNNCPI